MGSEKRKETWNKLITPRKENSVSSDNSEENYVLDETGNQVLDPLIVLTHLYSNVDEKKIEQLKACRLNPDYRLENHLRNDLEFFAPQLM